MSKSKRSVARPETPYKLVLIEWDDSARPIPQWQWIDEYQIPEIIQCVSVGYLIAKTKDAIAVAPNLGDTTSERVQASGITRVPLSSVRRIIEL
jgi:hypothetical protein